jgi:hypothetical protein
LFLTFLEVQEFRSSGVQKFRSSEVQKFRSSEVQEYGYGTLREQEFRNVAYATLCYQKYLVQQGAMLKGIQNRMGIADE